MESTRQKKISRLIQKDLAGILQKEGARLFPGQMITVTDVKVSADLGVAKVAVSAFPEKDKEEFLEKLKESQKEIRYALGKLARHQLRIIPELIFYIDDSLNRMDEIDQLLKS